MISRIENLLQTGIETRKLDGIKEKSQLKEIINELSGAKGLIIITGFPVYSKEIGETDGPLGAIAIAYALKNLGKDVFIVTDKYSINIVESLRNLLKINVDIYDIEQYKDNVSDLISSGEISHLLAIERPGKAGDGNYYSMRGINLNSLVSDTDLIFKNAASNGITTISVGDGGNELGFGNIRDYVIAHVYKGDLIASDLESDYILISSISNWGGYGIAKGLEIVSGKELIYDDKTEELLLEDIVKNGGVDGCTGKNEASVDGKSKEEYLNVIREIYDIK